MGTQVVPDIHSDAGKKEQIEGMFDDIAPQYDFLNRLLSFRIDVLWRKQVRRIVAAYHPQEILDVATGTGDLAIELSTLQPRKIVGADLSANMLAVGIEKIKQKKLSHIIDMVKTDAEHMPFRNEQFDAVTVAFGVRNFENLQLGLAEIKRVLKPGAPLVILEFSKVKMFPLKQLYHAYFRYITPLIGKLFSKSRNAYTYLPNSVAVFPEGEEMCVILQNTGFKQATCKPVSFGIASIYIAIK